MDKMKSRLMLAVVLGMLLGVGLAYSPPLQSNATNARPQVLMQPTTQGNFGATSTKAQASPSVDQTLIPLLVGLLFAVPIFLLAKRGSK